VIFVKLIRILAVILATWLIFHTLHWLRGKNVKARTMRQGDNGHTRRKSVESRIVEKANQPDDKAQS